MGVNAGGEGSRGPRRSGAMTTETVTEAEKMRRVPGVFYMDEPSGRCAKIVGTGLGVWEIVQSYQQYDEDWDTLVEYYDWLSLDQLRTVLRYWREFPDEIDDRIALEDRWTPETLYAAYPWARPKDV